MNSAKARPSAQVPHAARAAQLWLALALTCSGTAQAVGIGDITLLSRLGEPLKARVALSAGPEESLNESCLALEIPGTEHGNPDEFITHASLTLQENKGNPEVLIVGIQPINTAFVRLLLQVRCEGHGRVSRTFTLLPGLENTLSQPPEPALIQSPTTDTTTATGQPSAPPRPRAGTGVKRSKPAPAVSTGGEPPPSARSRKEAEKFKLRLSTNMIEAGPGTKLNEAERNQLQAQRQLLDQDDQTASFLALQHQVKLLQDELTEMRRQMGVPVSAPLAAASAPRAQSQAAPAPRLGPASAPAPATDAGLDLAWTDYLALGLVAALLLLLGVRLYRKHLKSRWTGESLLDEEETATPESAPVLFPRNLSKVGTGSPPPVPMSASEPPAVAVQPAAPVAPATPPAAQDIYVPESISTMTQPVAGLDEPQEADWVIEEAELYAVHGHPELAIQILEKLLDQSSEKPQAWLLLLSILSSLDRRDDFERTARRFATFAHSRAHWKEVQALGQRIDRDNPLYFGDPGIAQEAVVPLPKLHRRPLGAILLDNGALSEEVLMGVLAQFNPKRDGRIGAYLMQHGLITNEQLETALHIQRAEMEADAVR
jgi:hypothetical protein